MKSSIIWAACLLFGIYAFQVERPVQPKVASTLVPPALADCGAQSKDTVPPLPATETHQKSGFSGPSGSIKGSVLYEGGEVRKVLNVIKDEKTCGSADLIDESLLTDANGGIKWAVVSISSEVKGGKSLDELPGDRVLDQRTCVYQPHVVLIGVNQELTINNMDHTLHNVRTSSLMNDVVNKVQIYIPNMPHPSDKTIFTEPEIVDVLCDVHGWMKAYVHVVEHPYYAVTAADGSFEITGVPPGKYTLHVWQEKLGDQEQEVEVKVGKVTESQFSYKKLK